MRTSEAALVDMASCDDETMLILLILRGHLLVYGHLLLLLLS